MLDILKKADFEKVGEWKLESDCLQFDIHCQSAKNSEGGLYSLVIDDEPKFIGIANKSLQERMKLYTNSNSGYTKLVRNAKGIYMALSLNSRVEIFFLRNEGCVYNDIFPVDLSAGIFDSLIKACSPEWNVSSRIKQIN